MNVEIEFSASHTDGRVFLTWRPIKALVRIVAVDGDAASIPVRLSNVSQADGGAVIFARTLTHEGNDSIDLDLTTDGSPVEVWIGGKFQFASKSFGDVSIESKQLVNGQPTGPSLGRLPVMVRVRKKANGDDFSTKERNRFLEAMAALNGRGLGRFTDFRDMHDSDAYDQIHINFSFLPWHRAYLLDIERELQKIDAEVALPYWKFDEAAPKLMQPSFIGRSRSDGIVQFSSTNPLRNWSPDGRSVGVWRGNAVRPNSVINVRTEAESMRISEGNNANFAEFCDWRYVNRIPTGLEADPHNGAHGSHRTGWITNPTTSQLDPLFYLLHANVDRLWAKWQWLPGGSAGDRSNPNSSVSYISAPNQPFGQNRSDTLWPWDGVTRSQTGSRPQTAPGGDMALSSMTSAPGPQPTLSAMIDYLGAHTDEHLGFAYDDVPFEL